MLDGFHIALPGLHEAGLVCAATAGASVLRGLTGFGFALLAVPLIGLFLDPSQAVAVVMTLQVMVGLRDSVMLRDVMDRPALGRLSIGALVGTPIGVSALAWFDPASMRLAIAAMVIAGLAFLLVGPGRGRPEHPLAEAIGAGFLSGLFGGLSAMAGPPAVAYFIRAHTPHATSRASLMVFFFVVSVIAMPGLVWSGLMSGTTLPLALLALPVFLAGSWTGGLFFKRTSHEGWRRIAIALVAVMALASGARGAFGLMS